MKKIFFIAIFLSLVLPTSVFAKIGVGVGTGKIIVNEKLKPGIIYQLPPLTVLNTGDEPSDYEVSISHLEKQPQLIPQKEWFIFSPQKFHLDPGKVQVVNVKLNLPIAVAPGDYFAYLEGQPVIKAKAGETTIGIAAAAKLYFTIIPANIFAGIYYKIVSFWQVYSPWPQRFLILVGLILAGAFFKKFFNLQINLKKPGVTTSHPSKEDTFKPLHRLSRRERFFQKQNESSSSVSENKLDKDKNE